MYKHMMTGSSYILTVIEDECVPLAPKIPSSQLHWYVMIAVVCIITVLLMSVYIMECQKYRLRILRLLSDMNEEERKKIKRGWNLTRLKATTRRLEDEAVNRISNV